MTGGFYSAQGDYLESQYQSLQKQNPVDINGTNKINKIFNRKQKNQSCNPENISLDISLDTPSQRDDTSLSSSESQDSLNLDNYNKGSDLGIKFDINEIDNQIMLRSKFNSKKKSKRHKCIDFDLASVDSLESLDSGESLLRHIRYCRDCKDKIIMLIRKNKTNNKNRSEKLLDDIKCLDVRHKIINQIHEHIDTSDDRDDKYIVRKKTESSYKTEPEIISNIPEIKEIVAVCLLGFLIIIVLDLIFRTR